MNKEWQEASVELFFNDFENEKEVKQNFNNLKENVAADTISSFQQAVATLITYPATYAVVTEKHRIG
ncbi:MULTISPECIES: DUF1659 domain-containing protein [unclassified Jeotgalibaca]|uniref:DUF1659 domain-containing protein n=1 Tax=unclassified Jeotgalibaca TaxID=2621505 RepID=UPI003FD409B0